MTAWIAIVIAIGSLVVNIILAIYNATRAVGKDTQDILEKIDAEVDQLNRRFGDSLMAIRQKMTDMELWNRDHFISRGTFNLVVSEMKDSNRHLEEQIERRFDKIDLRLEKVLRSRDGDTDH